MRKSILLIFLLFTSFFYTTLSYATTPGVIILRHAEEGVCDFTETTEAYDVKTRGHCLTKLGKRHADLYNQKLDNFLRSKDISPITRVIVIDPYTLVQPQNMNYPTTNPYYTVFPYLSAHEFIKPEIIVTGPGMNPKVAELLKQYFNENNTGSTLIVWESKKLDTDVLGTALLTLLIKPSDIGKLPSYQGKITTTRDTLYLLTNGKLDNGALKYNVEVFFDYFNTYSDSINYKRDPSGDMSKEFGASANPDTIKDMIFCPYQGQNCDKNCACK